MRVAVVLEQCWHRVPGGTARAALEQVAAVASRGRDAGEASTPADDLVQVGVAARHAGPPPDPWRPTIPVRHLGLPRRLLYPAWHRWRRPPVQRATGPVDVIHATGYAVPPRSAPLVVTLNDLAWRHDPGNFTPHGVRFFESALRCTLSDADLVLCPSRATLADCRAAGVEPARLRHVPLGMRLATVSDEDVGRVRQRYGLGDRFILTVGTLEPRKNLGRLLDAFALLPQRDVTLAVVGPDGWGESLGPRIESLDGRARLLGFVPQADLAPLYRAAAAVCYPSLLEGYGLPVAEALGAGAAVVTSAGTATEELVTGGAGLAVDARDVDAIAGALASVLDDDDLAERLRRAGLARAARTTWDLTAERTVAAYREVA
ncbi:MAG: glycosyltransferase family 4 protein [Acidimicrobiia bacterium]